MSTKSAAIVTDFSGALVPATHGFEITDPSEWMFVVVDGMASGDAINLRRQNFAGDGWEPATDGKGAVQLNVNNTQSCPLKPGLYGLEGVVDGSVTIYTEKM